MSPAKTRPPSVTNYLIAELKRAGVDIAMISESRPGYGDPWKNVLMVRGSNAFTLWVVLHRLGEMAGMVQVEGFSEPFSPWELPRVGSEIVAAIAGEVTRRQVG